MAEFITDVIDVPELIGFVREANVDVDVFNNLFPAVTVDDIEYELQNVDFRADMQVAKYRSWDAAPVLGKRPGFEIIGGEIPPLGMSFLLKEKDLARLNRLRANVAQAGDNRIVDTIFNDASNAVRAVYNRLSWAQADLLTDGSVTIEASRTGTGVVATFAVPAAHLNVTPAIPFSTTASAVPVTEIKGWQATFRANNGGRNPDFWITSPEVVADLTLNAQIRNLSPANADGSTRGIVNETTVAQVLQANGIAPIVGIDAELPALDDSGNLGRLLGERLFIGVIQENLGSTFFGLSPTASVLAGNGTIEYSDAAGVIAFAEQSVRPAQLIVTGEGVAIPVLRDPNSLFVATV